MATVAMHGHTGREYRSDDNSWDSAVELYVQHDKQYPHTVWEPRLLRCTECTNPMKPNRGNEDRARCFAHVPPANPECRYTDEGEETPWHKAVRDLIAVAVEACPAWQIITPRRVPLPAPLAAKRGIGWRRPDVLAADTAGNRVVFEATRYTVPDQVRTWCSDYFDAGVRCVVWMTERPVTGWDDHLATAVAAVDATVAYDHLVLDGRGRSFTLQPTSRDLEGFVASVLDSRLVWFPDLATDPGWAEVRVVNEFHRAEAERRAHIDRISKRRRELTAVTVAHLSRSGSRRTTGAEPTTSGSDTGAWWSLPPSSATSSSARGSPPSATSWGCRPRNPS
jgi:hypothetical protein